MNIQSIDNIHLYWKLIFHVFKKASLPILEELGLTKVDANILQALSRHGGKTKAQLAESLSFSPNSLTRSIDRLVGLNLLDRQVDSKDQRFIKLSLTKKGADLAQGYISSMRDFWHRALQDVDDATIAELESTLQQMLANIHSEGLPCL